MSTQSILLKDKAHYAKEFEKQILWNADGIIYTDFTN